MKRNGSASARSAFLLALAMTVPACGGGHGSAPPPPGPAVLFDEEFNAFPNPDWSVSGSGVFLVDRTTGTPAPSLSSGPGTQPEASLIFESTIPVAGTDLTFSADILLDVPGPGGGVGSFSVRSSGTGASVADAALDGASGVLTLTIGGTIAPPFTPSAGWHRYEFFYDAAGNASWLVDGASLLSVVGFVPPASMVVSLENTSGADFNFDTVVITSP